MTDPTDSYHPKTDLLAEQLRNENAFTVHTHKKKKLVEYTVLDSRRARLNFYRRQIAHHKTQTATGALPHVAG